MRNQNHRNPNCFFEPAQKNSAQECDQDQGNADLMFKQFGSKRILNDVGGGVGGGKRNSDNESVATNPSKTRTTACPSNGTADAPALRWSLLRVAFLSYAAVYWQRAKQSEENKNERGNGRERAGCEKCNARLVTECRKNNRHPSNTLPSTRDVVLRAGLIVV